MNADRRGSRRRLAVLGGLLIVCALAGAGGYLVGESSGEDLRAARARGEEAGLRDAREAAARRGYTQGLKAGKKEGYRATYKRSYRTAYRAKTRKLERAAAREAAAAAQATPAAPNPYAGLEYTDELPNRARGCRVDSDALCGGFRRPAQCASDRGSRRRAMRRSTCPSRIAAGRASRSTRRG
jgi:hypothetical protein